MSSQKSIFVILLSLLLIASIHGEDLSGSGWRLWPDQESTWRDDDIFLPEEVHLAELPVHPPTGGWEMLNAKQGIAVTLPGSVEENYWGLTGLHSYTAAEYKYAADDTVVQNGNYLGVSWWWRPFTAPKLAAGERLVVRFQGARLRAEVYCNGQLCGYSILTELPFEADLTHAIRPGGDNVLAVRITNPGGGMDWRDGLQIEWGKKKIPTSHGFGGLDTGIEMEVRGATTVQDFAVLNQPDLHQVELCATVASPGAAYDGRVLFEITQNGKTLWKGEASAHIPAGGVAEIRLPATLADALPWSPEHPALYQASARLADVEHSGRETAFGFRWFTAEGIGQNARLVLNGKRIVVRSAISWGFWGPNGLWPDAEKAEKEVLDASALGLNCLQFHRNVGKTLVLDAQDRLGLLRYQEPGNGATGIQRMKPETATTVPVDTSGQGGTPRDFATQYMRAKILGMVRRDRSHPSLVVYCIQNEFVPDLRDPYLFALLREMHAIDPSRIIYTHSGIKTMNQAWMLPYEDRVMIDDGTGVSGWSDLHSVGGPGVYQDGLYKNPQDFSHDAHAYVTSGQDGAPPIKKEIVMFGEMLGVAVPDDHQAIVDWYRSTGRSGYDRADHEKILAAYDDFLTRYQFRTAFPTASNLFQSLGTKSYDFWRRMIEQTRFSNRVDYIVVSGWESTAIENHSGLVDAHRNFKADPAIMHAATVPELLSIKPRHLVLATGDTGLADVFLINETNRHGPQQLTFTVRDAEGQAVATKTSTVNPQGGDVYGELLQAALAFPAGTTPGLLTLSADLIAVNGDAAPLHREESVLVVDVRGAPLPARIAVIEPRTALANTFANTFGVHALGADALAGPLDAVVLNARAPLRPSDPKPKVDPDAPNDGKGSDSPVAGTTENGWETQLDALLPRVKEEGLRLVLWTDTGAETEQFARALASRNVITFQGMIGVPRASWMGSWYFVRRHWLFDGLPVDCPMDWRYQVTAQSSGMSDGLRITAPGMEVAAGYSRDHEAAVGIGACVIPWGKGRIVLLSLPGLYRTLEGKENLIHPVIARRLLGNTLR